ncbi:MAG: glycosyltransferase involved in cell wall biosynthesis, partial [Planctomycetaceae bacterium]
NGWTRGKCALKVIQYMAAGLPVVSDRCGANQEVILASETGYLADNENDWIEAITKLIDNEDLRTQMGVAGRARAQQLYDMKRVTSQVADQLVELCGD